MSLKKSVLRYVDLLATGRSLEAMSQFYAKDVVIFENRELVRSGQEACLAHEREQLSKLPSPPKVTVWGHAVNETDERAYIEWMIRVVAPDGHVMRLDEVAAQTWQNGQIVEERFYFAGYVDEGHLTD